MKKFLKPESIFVIILLLINIMLILIPTGFEENTKFGSERVKALVIGVDNSDIHQRGIVKTGSQQVKLRLLTGKFKGKEFEASNNLKGQLELDKIFSTGDKALAVVGYSGDNVNYVNVIDHYRINVELIMFLIFTALLIGFAGWVGVKSLMSFVFTILMIWKVLIPSFLIGINPIIISLVVVTIIIASTTCLVAGINKKSLVSFLGSFSGIVVTCILSIVFGYFFNVHGAIVPFSESLLYSGYAHLDLTKIFLAGIFIASSGAIMDVTMDISVAMHEIVLKKPNISRKEAIKSGFVVAKAVIGTMTTTLLLAYSGGYTALLMVFMAQGTPIINILNITYVAGEIMHTVVGSFGLILVAPLTVVVGGIIFTSEHKNVQEEHNEDVQLKSVN